MATEPLLGINARFFDANGDPLSGGKLYTYAAGTSTPLATYTTRAGDVANANPVVLDANGAADVWTTPGVLYKFVLQNALGVIQKTVDNFPSGGSSSAGATTTDAAGAVDPGGRLSLTTGTPVTTADVTGATTAFYVPHKHNKVPLYDGTAWALYALSTELSQATGDTTKSPAAVANNSIYDMFVWNDSGTLRLSRGPAWTSDTARGTGASTTELERVDGRYVNKQAIANGPAARRGLYVGSVRSNSSAQFTDSVAFRYVWNAYNRERRPMRRNDTTSSWLYSTDTWRQANASAANQLDFLLGLDEVLVRADVLALAAHSSTATGQPTASLRVGLGLDSTTVNGANTSAVGDSQWDRTDAFTKHNGFVMPATYEGFPGLGRHVIAWLERASIIGAGTVTWYGQSGGLYNSGMTGHVFG